MSKKILVVDDDRGILDALEVLLTDAGYEVETSIDGKTLEHLNKKTQPDLILLDMLLSGKDGLTLCQLIKNRKETKHIPIIMFSAHPNAEKSVQTSGADGFIAKPFKTKVLLEKINHYLAG